MGNTRTVWPKSQDRSGEPCLCLTSAHAMYCSLLLFVCLRASLFAMPRKSSFKTTPPTLLRYLPLATGIGLLLFWVGPPWLRGLVTIILGWTPCYGDLVTTTLGWTPSLRGSAYHYIGLDPLATGTCLLLHWVGLSRASAAHHFHLQTRRD